MTMNENDKQAEPVAWLCEWEEGWHQYHDAADPLPDEWDDAPKKITPLYAHPDPAVAVNEQMYNALKMVMDDPQSLEGRPRTFECVTEAIGAYEAAKKGGEM